MLKNSKKITLLCVCLVVIIMCVPLLELSSKASAASASEVQIGSYVSMGIYYDEPIIWRVIAKDSKGILLFADKIITTKAFNAAKYANEPRDGAILNFHRTGNGDRYMQGNNMWESSTIRNWLNSDQMVVGYPRSIPTKFNLYGGGNYYSFWWQGKYGIETLSGGNNAYAHEQGFLTYFQAVEKNTIVTVTQKTELMDFDKEVAVGGSHTKVTDTMILNSEYNSINFDVSLYHWTTDKVFLLSVADIKKHFPYNSPMLIGLATDKALINDDSRAYQVEKYPDSLTWGGKNANSIEYWLRTPGSGWGDQGISEVITVSSDSAGINFDSLPAYMGVMHGGEYSIAKGSPGVRPALYIQANTQLTGSGTEINPYRITGATDVVEVNVGNVGKLDTPSAWAISEIEAAKSYNLTTDKILVNYQNPITREEFCELAVKLYEALNGKSAQAAASNTFIDTNNPEILKAVNLGIVTGIGNDQFLPDANVTREQIALMFYRTMNVARPNMPAPSQAPKNFTDSTNVNIWAREAVADMSAREIIGGMGDGSFAPQGQATREQAIAMVKRVHEKLN